MIQIRGTLTPGWDEFRTALGEMITNLPGDADALVEAAAKDAAKKVADSIRLQTRTWTPLSPWYLRWKERHNLSLDILKATGFYMSQIAARKMEKYVYVAGVPDTRHPYWKKVTLAEIFRYLEFGTWRIPARPHFRPVLWEMKQDMLKLITKRGFTARVIR